jgi:hypothetical protein
MSWKLVIPGTEAFVKSRACRMRSRKKQLVVNHRDDRRIEAVAWKSATVGVSGNAERSESAVLGAFWTSVCFAGYDCERGELNPHAVEGTGS